ncbi:hypothetical protein D9M69_702160 [compost metagenome]
MNAKTVFIDRSIFVGEVLQVSTLNESDEFVWKDDGFVLVGRPSLDFFGDGELPVISIRFDHKRKRYRVSFLGGRILSDTFRLDDLKRLKLVSREAPIAQPVGT